MPFYQYTCKKCSVSQGVIHGMNDKFIKPCEYCGVTDWEQFYFPPAVQFKGTGFYETDYRKK